MPAFSFNFKMDAQKERSRMNYQEFAGAVEKKMNYKMEGGMRANLYRTLRNNGTERLGIMM